MNSTLQKSLKAELGTVDQQKIFNRIYLKYFSIIEIFVLKNNGTKADAQDLFQEVMIIVINKLERDDFVLSAKLKTYIVAIAKNLWYKKIRDQKEFPKSSENFSNDFYEEIDLHIEKEKSNIEKLFHLMGKVSSHCNQLISDIFFKAIPIEEIQQNYGYTSKHNAQNQKHKCIKQIKNKKIKVYG